MSVDKLANTLISFLSLCHFSLHVFFLLLSAAALLVGEKVQEETTLVVSVASCLL